LSQAARSLEGVFVAIAFVLFLAAVATYAPSDRPAWSATGGRAVAWALVVSHNSSEFRVLVTKLPDAAYCVDRLPANVSATHAYVAVIPSSGGEVVYYVGFKP